VWALFLLRILTNQQVFDLYSTGVTDQLGGVTYLFHQPSKPFPRILLFQKGSYAIWKCYLFSLDPALAAENILTTIPDSLILADMKAKIIRVNERLMKFSGYKQEELINKSIATLCAENQEKNVLMS
jgi:PAS domain-containing protein